MKKNPLSAALVCQSVSLCAVCHRELSWHDMALALLHIALVAVHSAVVSTVPLARSPGSSFRQVGISTNLYIGHRNTSLGRIERVCVVDDVAYYEDEAVPTTSACQQCVCKPPGFACNTVRCPPADADDRRCHKRLVTRQTGRDKCCPDYSCDCEKDGRIYQSGQKITDPATPCQVCYCQHGHIVCSVIRCLSRDDCQPVEPAQGRCCPSYDHCQPLAGQTFQPFRPLAAFLERPVTDQQPVADTESRHSASSAAERGDGDTVTTEPEELTTLDDRWASGQMTTTHLGNGHETDQLSDELSTTPMTDALLPEATEASTETPLEMSN